MSKWPHSPALGPEIVMRAGQPGLSLGSAGNPGICIYWEVVFKIFYILFTGDVLLSVKSVSFASVIPIPVKDVRSTVHWFMISNDRKYRIGNITINVHWFMISSDRKYRIVNNTVHFT